MTNGWTCWHPPTPTIFEAEGAASPRVRPATLFRGPTTCSVATLLLALSGAGAAKAPNGPPGGREVGSEPKTKEWEIIYGVGARRVQLPSEDMARSTRVARFPIHSERGDFTFKNIHQYTLFATIMEVEFLFVEDFIFQRPCHPPNHDCCREGNKVSEVTLLRCFCRNCG